MTTDDSTNTAPRWYPRPVFWVSDIQASLRFYLDTMGFKKKWHSGEGKGLVCQVDRSECEIILCQDAERRDKVRIFVELNREGLDELQREIAERSIPYVKTRWGYDSILITDPDGNELLFPTEI
jgi:catechol 2,3-dioxygenase-like lactoylglutathione lyase family enzyme